MQYMYIPPVPPQTVYELKDFFGVNVPINYDCEILIDVTANSNKLEAVILTVNRNREVSVFPLLANQDVLENKFQFPNLQELLDRLERYKLSELIRLKNQRLQS